MEKHQLAKHSGPARRCQGQRQATWLHAMAAESLKARRRRTTLCALVRASAGSMRVSPPGFGEPRRVGAGMAAARLRRVAGCEYYFDSHSCKARRLAGDNSGRLFSLRVQTGRRQNAVKRSPRGVPLSLLSETREHLNAVHEFRENARTRNKPHSGQFYRTDRSSERFSRSGRVSGRTDGGLPIRRRVT